jgi:hypothetical protein
MVRHTAAACLQANEAVEKVGFENSLYVFSRVQTSIKPHLEFFLVRRACALELP